MKPPLPLVIGLLLLATRPLIAIEANYNVRTAGWLEKGCAALQIFNRDPAGLKPDQANFAKEVGIWIDGFLGGVNATNLLVRDAPEIAEPPEEWRSVRTVAPSIAAFIKKHEAEIPASLSAWELMLCWYLECHPKSTELHKNASAGMLRHFVKEHKTKGGA